jgi:hypothetical protein
MGEIAYAEKDTTVTELASGLTTQRRRSPGASSPIPTPFRGARFVRLIADVALQGCEQKRAEFATCRIGRSEKLALDDFQKETLDQILGIMGGIATTTAPCVKRKPIGTTKIF